MIPVLIYAVIYKYFLTVTKKHGLVRKPKKQNTT